METKRLACKLTDVELNDRTSEMLKQWEEHDRLEAKLKADTEEAKGVIKGTMSEVRRLARVIREREEYRDVEVEEEFDYPMKRAHMRRKDTGDIISSRDLDGDELNQPLPLETVEGEKVEPAKKTKSVDRSWEGRKRGGRPKGRSREKTI